MDYPLRFRTSAVVEWTKGFYTLLDAELTPAVASICKTAEVDSKA